MSKPVRHQAAPTQLVTPYREVLTLCGCKVNPIDATKNPAKVDCRRCLKIAAKNACS